jgi:hypothetical protein
LAQTSIDFGAIGRVSPYAELVDVRLTEVSAKCSPVDIAGALNAEVSNKCSVLSNENAILKVSCEYHFTGSSAQPKLVDIAITYIVSYSLNSPQPLADADIAQFAAANGTLHSWPFIREFLHSLTSRMGIPPFKLGVMHFVPMPTPTPPQPANAMEATKAEKPSSQ